MKPYRLLFALLLVALSFPALAETWYEVEVIVLAHRNADRYAEEWPTTAPDISELDTALPLPAAQEPTDPRLAPLPAEEMRLIAEAQRIAADPNYTLLLHAGWRQPGLAKEQSFPLRMYAVSAATPNASAAVRLDGTLRLILSRYLHLDADLRYFPEFAADDDEHHVYRLKESRRMRSRELHYLDHPLFGVIALVTPYDVPTPAPPAPKK